MMPGEWRIIKEFPDYAVSGDGMIKNLNKGNILKPRVDRYCYLTLYRDKQPFVILVHRIVCIAFHGEPPSPRHEVAHGDGCRYNNHKDNLRWATHVENEADKITHGTSLAGRPSHVPIEHRAKGATHGRYTKPERTARGERGGRAKLTEKSVLEIRLDTRTQKILADEYGVSRAMIGYVKRGTSWAHVPMPTTTGDAS